MTCTCGAEIPAARLEALPSATTCVDCSTEQQVRGAMIWEGKTAPTIEIGTALADAQTAKVRFGPHIKFNARENPRMLASVRAAADRRAIADLVRDRPVEEPAMERATANPARCHADRERIGPSGLCLECALYKQKQRLRG